MVATIALGGLVACDETQAPSSEHASLVEHGVPEADIARVTLSEAAISRLGIETVEVERRSVPRARTVGGEVVSPPGATTVVAAPFSGIVQSPARHEIPLIGALLQSGQPVIGLLPLPGQSLAAGSAGDLEVRRAEYSVAKARADRVEQLVADKAASAEEFEQARVELARAQAVYDLARAQAAAMTSKATTEETGAAALLLAAPYDGHLRSLRAVAGQTVSAGDAIFEIVGRNPLWVRVPIYAGDLESLDRQTNATIRALNRWSEAGGRSAAPLSEAVLARPETASLDVYFEIENSDGAFHSGERVAVDIRLQGSSSSLVVPESALFRDIHGGAWVYVGVAPRVFSRHRVAIDYMVGDDAVLSHGPDAGTLVVSVGVAEIVGTEFGVGH